jgi:catechol 2,3-dioxygenase-like lactoylglutathione lyase family enzyme
MQPARFSASILTSEPAAVAAFYTTHFGLTETLNLGWFITLRRDDADWEVCVWEQGHESVPGKVRPGGTGVVLAFVTEDAAGAAARFAASGVPVVAALRDEPWGQRHLYVADPAGTVIDVVEFIPPDPAWLAEHAPG